MMRGIRGALKPIRTKKDYQEALRLLDKYFDAEEDEVEVLSILIEKYEEEHFAIDPPDPIEAIKFRMEQLGLSQKDVALMIGSRSRVSEILSGKRGLTIDMIKTFHKNLGIPAESLIGD